MKMGRKKIHGVSGTLLARQPNEPSEAAAPDSNLEGYGDVYTVRDLRKRAKKEPTEVKALNTQNLDIKLTEKAPENYIGEGFKKKDFAEGDFRISYYEGPDGKYYKEKNVRYFQDYIADDTARREGDKITFKNTLRINYKQFVKTTKDNYLYLAFNITAPFVNLRHNQTWHYSDWGFYFPLDLYCVAVVKECERILAKNSKTSFEYKVADKVRFAYYHLWQSLYSTESERNAFSLNGAAGLGKPTIKLEFENNDDLQKFFKDHEENLIDSYVEDATIVEDEPDTSRRHLKGMAGKDPSKYNYKLENLKCEGMAPTYKKLNDYGHLIGKASNKNTLIGYGFDNTEKLLIDKVAKNYKSVAPLANHLKADSERQSAFNVWYWLHENIRYNYDAPGVEEIRSPARVWEDRKSGVDCDCLAVFTYCLLLAMGYRPKFEIVAFRDTWAHIYVNLNGLAVDRVLPKFGARPPLIQKTKMLEVPVYSLEGVDLNAALSGLEATVLKKIDNGTATIKDCCDLRKARAVKRFSDSPVEQKVMAMFMPYVYDVDPTDGAIYFYGQPIAKAARQIDRMLQEVAMTHKNSLSGLSDAELNGILKKIGGALKKAATATVKAVAAPVKAAVQVTTSAVKATTNAVKATANVVKAGVQAATGNADKAKESLQKAGEQAKAAVVQPVKDAVNITKETVKETVVQPTTTAVRATVEIVKVILVKLNPVTVLMRNALRALVAINFLGMAGRVYVCKLTPEELKAGGYTDEDKSKASKAYNNIVNFYLKMGGSPYKMIDTIAKGAKRKALFKGDYKESQVINDDDTLSGLGEPVTIASCLAAVGSFFAAIWKWIKNIAVWVFNNQDKIANTAQTVSTVVSTVKEATNGNGGGATPATTTETTTDSTEVSESGKSGKTWLLIAAGVAFVAVAASGKKKKKK